MSKYDFEIDLSQNTSTGRILSKIQKGSVVLEFGCATGRMTRYMKEALGCQVYIVEYDKDAYETARQYAEDGLCDDILRYRWVEAFGSIRFDAILFADVLEHLTDPETALARAAGLLKDTGCLYASIPNVTHNDILLKACEEHFDYTATGLLDDTHVHFWGLKNIEALSGKCGLHIREIEGTYCPTGYTEQYAQAGRHENTLLENILKERQCGEVYQFVVTFDKCSGPGTVYTFRAPSIQSHIYLDTGADFNQEERIDLESPYSGRDSYTAHYVISEPGRIKRVRFDPIELQSCILRRVTIRQDGRALPLITPNAVDLEEGILLLGKDPMVYTDVLTGSGPIEIDADIVVPGEQYVASMQDACMRQRTESDSLHGQISGLRGQISSLAAREAELRSRLSALDGENQSLRGDLDAKRAQLDSLQEKAEGLAREKARLRESAAQLSRENKELQSAVANMARENAELRTDLGAYIILADNKDKYALSLEQELDRYKNLRVVKLYHYLRRLWRGAKRRVKGVIRKRSVHEE